jgi:Recombination endonuclease VII/Stc1 domain
MNKEIVKVCKIHGELTLDKVGPYRNKPNKNGTQPTHYLCKACRTNKRRRYKYKTIHTSEEYKKINILFDKLNCSYCKNSKKHEEFTNYQLKNKYPKCKLCSSKMGRKYYILNTYKLTNDEYEKLLKEQNYVCKICGQNETAKLKGITKKLAVDHCHTSKKNGQLKIRGLLCHNCNVGLGAFRDNPDYLKKAAQYLEMQDV